LAIWKGPSACHRGAASLHTDGEIGQSSCGLCGCRCMAKLRWRWGCSRLLQRRSAATGCPSQAIWHRAMCVSVSEPNWHAMQGAVGIGVSHAAPLEVSAPPERPPRKCSCMQQRRGHGQQGAPGFACVAKGHPPTKRPSTFVLPSASSCPAAAATVAAASTRDATAAATVWLMTEGAPSSGCLLSWAATSARLTTTKSAASPLKAHEYRAAGHLQRAGR
jgi:hypothetical protein